VATRGGGAGTRNDSGDGEPGHEGVTEGDADSQGELSPTKALLVIAGGSRHYEAQGAVGQGQVSASGEEGQVSVSPAPRKAGKGHAKGVIWLSMGSGRVMNVTHVWGIRTLVPRVFPELRSIVYIESSLVVMHTSRAAMENYWIPSDLPALISKLHTVSLCLLRDVAQAKTSTPCRRRARASAPLRHRSPR
jgi:hypothetical protein